MKRLIHSIFLRQRAKDLYRAGRQAFETAVCGCVYVSRFNHVYCFAVKHVGLFGGPAILLMDRPDVVCMGESFNGVIVKDGIIYEMIKC